LKHKGACSCVYVFVRQQQQIVMYAKTCSAENVSFLLFPLPFTEHCIYFSFATLYYGAPGRRAVTPKRRLHSSSYTAVTPRSGFDLFYILCSVLRARVVFFFYYYFRRRHNLGGRPCLARGRCSGRRNGRHPIHTRIVSRIRTPHEHHLEHRNFGFFSFFLLSIPYTRSLRHEVLHVYTYFCIRLLVCYRPPPPVLAPAHPCFSQVRVQGHPVGARHHFSAYTRPTRVRSVLSPGPVPGTEDVTRYTATRRNAFSWTMLTICAEGGGIFPGQQILYLMGRKPFEDQHKIENI
jgi:hypothetical protein